MRRLRRRAAAPLAAVLLLSGCFTYRAADPAALPAGEAVRLRLTRQGAAALPEIPGQDGTALTGRLMGREDGRLLLRVRVAVQRDALGSRDLGRDVSVPADAVLAVERRTFDRVRTGLTVAAGVGVLAVLAHAFGSGDDPGGGEVVPPPPEGARLPLLSLPLR